MKYVFRTFVFLCLLCSGCQSTENKKDETSSPSTVIKEVTLSDKKEAASSGEQVGKRGGSSKNTFDKRKSEEKLEARYDVKCVQLGAGSNSRVASRIIRSIDEIENRQDYNDDVIKSMLQVDFSKYAVVVASAGTFNTGGYSISLASAILNDGVLNLTFKVKSPEPYDFVTQAFTYPYVVVLVEVDETTKINMNILGGNTRNNRRLEF